MEDDKTGLFLFGYPGAADQTKFQLPFPLMKCPTLGCDGTGHVTGNFASHRSLSGCPIANKPKSKPVYNHHSKHFQHRCNSVCSRGTELHKAVSVVTARKSKSCPTPGCDGFGHISESFMSHRSLSGCPAAVKTEKKLKHSEKVIPAHSNDYSGIKKEKEPSDSCEDLMTLEAEITTLHKENDQAESQMMALKSSTNEMEYQLADEKKENQLRSQSNDDFNKYYERLRDDMIARLEKIYIPLEDGGALEKPSPENFDRYLSKLQSLCAPDSDLSKDVYETVKAALKTLTLPPMPMGGLASDEATGGGSM